jgi:peroxiredoxin Q/BCP|tara:strand:- start:1245 stop:1670 length:426 start_codon:yes stop_codon:yes gene_type:complete
MEYNSTSGPINIEQIDRLILYFYPRDNTPGCTSQAVMYSTNLDYFNKKGIKIIGVSKDSIKSHEKFIKKHDLKINLISDEDLLLNKKFDVWKLKKFMGREYMGTDRSTFYIEKGKIIKKWNSVKIKNHLEELKKFLDMHIS